MRYPHLLDTPGTSFSDNAPELHNDHNVYICGAGFSAAAGIPLVSNFYLQMRNAYYWLLEKGRTTEADAIKSVILFRIDSSAAGYWTKLDLENIEELFSLAAASSKRNLLNKIPLAIGATIEYAIQNFKRTSIVGQSNSHENDLKKFINIPNFNTKASRFKFEPYAHHVGKLLGIFNNGKIVGENTFITFNYDTLIEESLRSLNVAYSYSFAKSAANYDQTDLSVREEASAIKILKLHGSVNWAKKTKNRGRSFTVFGSYQNVRENGLNPALVAPTWQKEFNGPLTNVWSDAVLSIEKATRLVIIGFSIPKTDTHFKYLVSAGLRRNASLRSIHIVDPDGANIVASRVKEFIPDSLEARGILFFHKVPFDSFTMQASTHSVVNIGREWDTQNFTNWSHVSV
jgi:hypothetical protein